MHAGLKFPALPPIARTGPTCEYFAMSLAYAQAVAQYGQAGPLASTREQSPQQLVESLLGGALTRIALARKALASGDAAARGQASTRAIEILGYLDGILDVSTGGALAQRLRSLYEYCIARIMHANLHRDDAAYAEVTVLVGTIKQAWDAMPASPRQAAGVSA